MEDLHLLTSIALVLGIALLGGMVARQLRLPIIIGYLASGIIIGPNVTGLVSDTDDVETLATVGVVLLMFTLGIEFSLKTLRKVGLIAILGGIAQIICTVALGLILAKLLSYGLTEAILFGFFISLSSTIIVLKTLMERGEMGSPHGLIMTGILLVQDLSVVPMIAILPAFGDTGVAFLENMGWAILKAGIFLSSTVILGFWVVPWLMKRVAIERSRELFLLAIVCLCFGAGFTANYFGMSIALGAFLAGLLVSESDYTYQIMADIRPLRDVFAVLFFVSLGMLADPGFIAENPAEVGIVVMVVMLGKFGIMLIIPRMFGHKAKTNLFVGSGLFQIGEFSFIIAALALEDNLISEDLYSLTMATAFITILLTPLAMSLTSKVYYKVTQSDSTSLITNQADTAEISEKADLLSGHAVICGYGRVARHLGKVLERRDFTYLVIDIDPKVISAAQEKGTPCIFGDASHPEVLAAAGLKRARVLVIAFPDPIATRLCVKNARSINHRLDIVARVHAEEDTEILRDFGVARMVRPELEAGLEIIRHTLHRFGLNPQETQYIVNRLREEEI